MVSRGQFVVVLEKSSGIKAPVTSICVLIPRANGMVKGMILVLAAKRYHVAGKAPSHSQPQVVMVMPGITLDISAIEVLSKAKGGSRAEIQGGLNESGRK